jgi:hypothetical protein
MRGIATVSLPPGLMAPAPRSGVQLGLTQSGPCTVRLFRPSGTRIAAVATLAPFQLLVSRAAAAGVTVRVLTGRPGEWEPLLASGPDARTLPSGSDLPLTGVPTLVVDDRPEQARRLGEGGAWRCRIDVRTPATTADLRTLTAADVLLVGGLVPDLAVAATAGFGVSVPHLSQLTSPAQGTLTVLRRGGIDYVTLDPSSAERALLERAR